MIEEECCLEELKQYAEKTYKDKLVLILQATDVRQHRSVAIDTMSLLESNLTFAYVLFECPQKALTLLNQAFQKVALRICRIHDIKTDMITKGTMHVRLTALPNLPEIYRNSLPHCSDVGQFMCVSGTVIRATTSKVLEFRKMWKCKKCKYQFTIDAEVEKGYIFEKPNVCPNPEWCNGKSFTLLSTEVDPEYCKDYREIKIQQQFSTLTVGSVPRSMWVILEDDLVETCHPGNDVNVCGILIQRWKPLSRGNFIDIDLVLLAHNVEVKNKMNLGIVQDSIATEFGQFWIDNQKDPLKGRDFILSSICPQVFGLYIVKLAVALVLAGGVEKKDGNSRIRGDSHLLLVGDPGTGKSQFLKFASKVSTRAVLTSGIGTTNAGLTVSAVKEGGKWQLEAGALVLADGGVCCIDEFSCIKEQDKTCIHEAMEQQTISVAKAGLVCSLSTKCSILAVTNPKGKYDENLSLSENTTLASPLLSRFDIILVLLDTYDENWDKMVSSYILEQCNISARTCKASSWSITKVRSYFSLIQNINPKVSSSCDRVLQAYYKRQRNLEGRNCARTTPRLLQSLIRLAEGHARLMLRSEVLVIDAVMAIVLMESSMSGSAILDGLTTLHTSFPEDPKAEYDEKAKTVLKLLNLDDLLTHADNYCFSYQNLSVKSLLTKVSGVCDSSKNSNLSHNFECNDISRISSTIPEITDNDCDHIKVPFQNTDSLCTETMSPNSNIANVSLGTFSEADDPSLFKTPPQKHGFNVNNFTQKYVLPGKQNVVDDTGKRGNSLNNEISTLSDLRNEFSNDKTNCFERNFKRKHQDGNLLEIFFKESQTGLFEQENNLNRPISGSNLNKNSSYFKNDGDVSTSPQAKKKSLEKPAKVTSFKKFSFQRSNRSKSISVTNIDGANFNSESSTNVMTDISDCRRQTSVAHSNKCTEATTSKNISENNYIPVCNQTMNRLSVDNADVHNAGKLDVLEQITTNIVRTEKNKESTKKMFSDVPNNFPIHNRHVEKQENENAFKKFAFKSRSPKKNHKPEATKIINHASTSASEMNKIPKSAGTIQSSQSAFKRIFSSSVGGIDTSDLDLDEDFLKL